MAAKGRIDAAYDGWIGWRGHRVGHDISRDVGVSCASGEHIHAIDGVAHSIDQRTTGSRNSLATITLDSYTRIDLIGVAILWCCQEWRIDHDEIAIGIRE